MTRPAPALRVAVIALGVLWWLPTIALLFGVLAWREVRFRRGLARVRRLRRAGRFADATAAMDRLWRDLAL